MLSDDEILGLWSEGKAQPPARPVLGRKKVLAFARAVERVAYERAAQIVEPSSPRPCDCAVCDCGNSGDRRAVIQWDEATMLADAIRALGRQHD